MVAAGVAPMAGSRGPGPASELRAARDAEADRARGGILGPGGASTLLLGALLAIALPWSARDRAGRRVRCRGAHRCRLARPDRGRLRGRRRPRRRPGLASGALTFSAGNWALHRGGAVRHRKRSRGQQGEPTRSASSSARSSTASRSRSSSGSRCSRARAVGLAFLAAVAISNLPEAISATTGLRPRGWTTGRVLAAVDRCRRPERGRGGVGYGALVGPRPSVVGSIQAFAAGAVLTMLADTMMPEAFEEAGRGRRPRDRPRLAIGALLTLV